VNIRNEPNDRQDDRAGRSTGAHATLWKAMQC
jgi:hypothetical protein